MSEDKTEAPKVYQIQEVIEILKILAQSATDPDGRLYAKKLLGVILSDIAVASQEKKD